ncbi:MAG: DUF4911 domain-containing protein [Desulfitobacteriia bacterium]|jgi:hypothetical protein
MVCPKNNFQDSDLIIRAKVSRPDIQLLCKFVEGMGHLGVVTTVDRFQGDVIIQTTEYCWPELKNLLSKLGIEIAISE